VIGIRPEHAGDLGAVRELHLAAFGDHGQMVGRLVEGLWEAHRETAVGLVAVDGDEIVGHALFTPSLLDAPPRLVEVAVLSPLAVSPAHQGQGVGGALVRQGLDRLAERSCPAVFLEGDPRYYGRFGFRAGKELGFRKPSLRIPDAGFQVLLMPSYEPWMTGTLVYSPVFWEHDAVGLRDSPGLPSTGDADSVAPA
jgi:putative acetyltransferase